jgi:hypothetical protein
MPERFNLQNTKDLEFRKENYFKAFNRFSAFVKLNDSSKFDSIAFAFIIIIVMFRKS